MRRLLFALALASAAVARPVAAKPMLTKLATVRNDSTTVVIGTVTSILAGKAIDFSDHLNFWRHGWQALMLSNTAFNRNKRYHQVSDTWDTLDYSKTAALAESLFNAVLTLDRDE